MPRGGIQPPTDEDIIRGFSPEEQEYYQFLQDLNSHSLDRADQLNAIHLRFPLGDGLARFQAFVDRWERRHIQRMMFPISVIQLINQVAQTNFTQVDSMDVLLNMMERRNIPFIYLGESSFGGCDMKYGITPNAYRLWPNLNSSYREGGVLDTNIMAINLDVPGGFGRKNNHVVPLMRDAQASDLEHVHGFVFAQLGPLRRIGEELDALIDLDDDKAGYDWFDTDFVAVVKISYFGQPESVWVIYNFHEDSGDMYAPNDQMVHVRTVDENNQHLASIGRLYDDCDQVFTLAKIADNLEELKRPRHPFTFVPHCATERQIVKAKLYTSPLHRTMIGPRFIAAPAGPNGVVGQAASTVADGEN